MPGEPALEAVVGMLALNWEAMDPASQQALPNPGAIDLWSLDLTTQGTALARCLTPADHARGARIVNAEKRRLYLGGRAGMRYLLGAYTGIPATGIGFAYGSRGKPVLAEPSVGLHFNYSLSRDKVLYALATDRELGVDMEALPRPIAAARLARGKLAADERSAWESLPEARQNDAMLCCWTRKEAYGKALGVGIRYYLGAVSLFADPARYDFRTPRTGLFADTDTVGMPAALAGVQVGLPFAAVASLMYPAIEANDSRPRIHGRRLEIH